MLGLLVGLISMSVMMAGFRLSAADAPKLGGPTKLDTVTSVPPKEWTAEKPANRLRSHQYRLPRAKGDAFDGEVVILPDVRETPEKNFERWKLQFEPLTSEKVDRFTVGKAKLARLDARGTWKFKERPFDPKSKEEMRANYRVIWVIFELPDANFQIRFSGPAATVAQYADGFDQWLRAFK